MGLTDLQITHAVTAFATARAIDARFKTTYYKNLAQTKFTVQTSAPPLGNIIPNSITVSGSDQAAFQSALNLASPGDTVQVPDGNYNFTGPLTIKSGTIFKPINRRKVTLNFNLPGNDFAILATNTSTATVTGFNIRSNCGIFLVNGSFGFTATDNDLSWGSTSRGGYARHAIRGYGTEHCTFTLNNLHDAQNSDRDGDWTDSNYLSVENNTFVNCHYGMHIDNTSNHVRFRNNRGSGYEAMALEIQANNAAHTDDILVEGNVYTDWRTPTNWSFGLSIMPQFSTNVVIRNNYLSTGSAAIVSGGHFGYGIEAGLTTGIVEGNVLIGPWVMAITNSMPNTSLKNNKAYGSNPWGAFGTEPGNGGPPSIKDLGGQQGNLAIAQAPTPEAFIASLGGTPPPPPPPTMNITITNIGVGSFHYDITNAPPVNPSLGLAGGLMYVKDAKGKMIGKELPITALSGDITNCPQSWDLLVSVSVGGQGAAAPVFRTLGTAPVDWQAEYARQPAVKGATTPPPPDPSLNYDVITSIRAGKFTGSKQVAVP